MRQHGCVIFWMWLIFAVSFSVCSGQTYEEGMAQYDLGNYQDALDIFSRLFKDRPDDEQVNFALGISALAAGKYSHALFAFERVLMQDPDNARARLELARTYYRMGHYELARQNFEKVQGNDPPERVEANIDKYLSSIKLRLKKWEVSGDFALSGFHDDNVNYGPSSAIIDSDVGELEVVSNSLPKKVFGASAVGRAELSYDLGDRQYWSALVNVNAYNNWLEEAKEQEIMFYGAGARLRRAGPDTLIDLPVRVDRLIYGHDPLVNIFGIDPALIWVLSPSWVSITRAAIEYRDYLDDSGRDGPYYRMGEMVKKYFGQGRHYVSLQAQGFYDRANVPGFENYGWDSSLGVDLTVLEPLSLYGVAQYRWMRYKEELYPDLQDTPREDDQFQLVVGTVWKQASGWGVNFTYRYVKNNSNFDLYTYDRNVFTLSSFYQF